MRQTARPTRSLMPRSLALASAAALVLVPLSGCSSKDDSATTSSSNAPSASSSSTPAGATSASPSTSTKTESSSSPSAAPTQAPLSLTEAVRTAMAKTPSIGGNKWDASLAGKTYHPDAELSFIQLFVDGGSSMSGSQVVMFHRGQYLGPLLAQPMGHMGAELKGSTVEVSWLYARPGEPEAQPTGEAKATYRWDEATKKVVRNGDLPPDARDSALVKAGKAATSTTTTTAFVPGKGKTPAGVLSPTNIYRAYGGAWAAIKTPSGKMGCDYDVKADRLGCGHVDWIQSRVLGKAGNGDPLWWLGFGTTGDVVPGMKGDAPMYQQSPAGAQILQYGQAVKLGSFVCLSETKGLTCWKFSTGHGALLNKDGFKRL